MDKVYNKAQYPLNKNTIIKRTLWVWSYFVFLALMFVMVNFFQPGLLSTLSAISVALPKALAHNAFFDSGWLSVAYVLAALFVVIYPYQMLYFKSYDYEIDDKNVMVKKGVFSVSHINIPFNRIQDVYIDQDFLDRLFGLYDLHFSNASSMSSMKASHIDGLGKEAAEVLRLSALEQIKKFNPEGKDNVY